MHVQKNQEMMSCLLVSSEPSIMVFRLEIDITNFSHLATLNFVRMEPTSSAPRITYLATIFDNGWEISLVLR